MTHPVIRVADTHGGVFLHPTAVLEVLAPKAAGLHWTILDVREAFAPEGSDFDVLAVADEVEQSATGLHVTYDEHGLPIYAADAFLWHDGRTRDLG